MQTKSFLKSKLGLKLVLIYIPFFATFLAIYSFDRSEIGKYLPMIISIIALGIATPLDVLLLDTFNLIKNPYLFFSTIFLLNTTFLYLFGTLLEKTFTHPKVRTNPRLIFLIILLILVSGWFIFAITFSKAFS